MDLLEKIELFYKMAQQLESELGDSPDETSDVDLISNSPVTASVQNRMAKLAKLAKNSKGK